MGSTFLTVVNMSITASIVILFVLLGRVLLKRTPKIFSYVLWAVVLFRLLCPISLPADFSLLSFVPATTAVSGHIEHISLAPLPTAEDPATTPSRPATGQEDTPAPVQAEDSAARPAVSLLSVGTGIWLAGMGGMVLYGVVQVILLRRRLVGSVPVGDAIYCSDYITTPFVAGVFHPRIYLPSTLPDQEASYILAHERHHIARGDHITRLLAFAALCLHWFNPLVWLAFLLSGNDMELSCDEAVMQKMERDIRAEYSTSLLQLSIGRRLMPLAFGQGDIKERIENVMRYKKPTLWVILAAVVLCVALTAGLSTNPAADEDPAGQDSGQSAGLETPSLEGLSSDANPEMQAQLFDYLSGLFDAAYSPYYEGLRYQFSNYQDRLDGDSYTATFLWTMYNLDSGGDISSDAGREMESNYFLLATGTVAEGSLTDITVLADTSLSGPAHYSMPVEDFFPGTNSSLTLTGYITEMDPAARTFDFDQVFWLTSPENDALLTELGVTEAEMPNGYYIYNPETDIQTYSINSYASFQVFDTPEESPWTLKDTDLTTLANELNTRTPLYTVTVKNGVVTQISERYVP